MSSPACGALYESRIPRAQVQVLLVLSEDAWNSRMGDSVVVPVYRTSVDPSDFWVEVASELLANCTKVQNIPHKYFGRPLGSCRDEPWIRTRLGVRRFLDLDARAARTPGAAVATARADWWPRQRDIHFATMPSLPDDKLFATISDDAWNSRPQVSYCATVRLTSRTKDWRDRWEVPVRGGWVVSGDLYSTAYQRMQPAPPDADRYPTTLTLAESEQVALRQKQTLTL